MTRLYSDKGSTYYSSARREILPLLPHSYARVLELGCGEGATLAWLKSINRCDEGVGIELSEKAAVTARQVVDQVICADIERDRIEFPNEYFDLILCLDVLEHLRDPWQTLSNLTRWLKPDGTVVVSIPNVRYKSVLVDLVLRGKFEYEDSGILDKTHLRFFTRASCHSLLEGAGLSVVSVLPNPRKVGGKWGLINALSFGYFGDIFVWQYLMAAAKIAPSAASARVAKDTRTRP